MNPVSFSVTFVTLPKIFGFGFLVFQSWQGVFFEVI
jgi:hypothetical protein